MGRLMTSSTVIVRGRTRWHALVLPITVTFLACRGGAIPAPAAIVEPIAADPKVTASEVVAVRAGHLIDPATGTSRAHQTVVIRAGKIESVGGDAVVPDGARIVDLSTSWVLPG